MSGIADGQHLPLMSVRNIPVDDAASVLCVDLPVNRAAHITPKFNACSANAAKDGIELGFVHAKTVVNHWKRFIELIKVERQPIIHIDRREWPNAGFRPRYAEKSSE